MIYFYWSLIIIGILGYIALWIFNNRQRWKFFKGRKFVDD